MLLSQIILVLSLLHTTSIKSPESSHSYQSCHNANESTLDQFLQGYKTNNLRMMYNNARCAIRLRTTLEEIALSINNPTLSSHFGYAVVEKILNKRASNPTFNQIANEDIQVLRHLFHHGITFQTSSVRDAVLQVHIPLISFLVNEAHVVPSSTSHDGWQPLQSIFSYYGHVQSFAKTLLGKNKTNTIAIHQTLIDHSPILNKLWNSVPSVSSVGYVSDHVLYKGMNEVSNVILDIFLHEPFISSMLIHPFSKHTHRTIIHAAAQVGDVVSLVRILELIQEKCYSPSKHQCSFSSLINEKDAFGLTALDLAIRSHSVEAIEILKNASSPAVVNAATAPMSPHRQNKRCTIDRIHVKDLDNELFWNKYVFRKRPLLIQSGSKKWKAFKKWNLNYLDRHIPKNALSKVGNIPYAIEYGIASRKISSLRSLMIQKVATDGDKSEIEIKSNGKNAITSPPDYVFDASVLSKSSRLMKDIVQIPQFARSPKNVSSILELFVSNSQLYVGAKGSGAPFHFHSDAVNANFRGSTKKYYLLPPNFGFYSTIPAKEFMSSTLYLEGLPQLRICQQKPGDILFIPSTWSHAVINTGNVIGVATELMSRHGSLWTGRWD